jgi:hypothetical protein
LSCCLQALDKSFDFIIDTASGDHPFDLYMSLLKISGVLVLVGFPSEVKFSPASLILGTYDSFLDLKSFMKFTLLVRTCYLCKLNTKCTELHALNFWQV